MLRGCLFLSFPPVIKYICFGKFSFPPGTVSGGSDALVLEGV